MFSSVYRFSTVLRKSACTFANNVDFADYCFYIHVYLFLSPRKKYNLLFPPQWRSVYYCPSLRYLPPVPQGLEIERSIGNIQAWTQSLLRTTFLSRGSSLDLIFLFLFQFLRPDPKSSSLIEVVGRYLHLLILYVKKKKVYFKIPIIN